jgi:2'-hydroxyisoflavone reductase
MSCASKYVRPLRILILGGTTFLGIHTIQIAQQRGHTVTLFNRGNTRSELFPDVERLKGDRDGQLEALKGRTWDAVIDNCGFVPRLVRMSAELLQGAVQHYLFISTISVYADFAKPNDEDSPLARIEDETREDVRNAYGALKALCETALEVVMPGRTALIRPGLIVGPEDPTDRFTYWPARMARGGEMLTPEDPKTSYQLIDARDLARFCIKVLEDQTTGVFNVTSPPGFFTVGDIVRESASAARALGIDSPADPTWVPAEFLTERDVQSFVDLPGWLPQGGSMGALHQTSVERALDAGLEISPLRETVRDTLAWHLARAENERIPLRAGLAPARERELLAQWHAKTSKI